MQSSGTAFIRFWQRIPVVIQAIIVGFFVFEIGVVAWVVIVAPLVPAPWSILVMAGVLWLYWKYFNGSWWPKTTAEARRKSFRDVKLSASVWKRGLLAAIFFVVVVQSGLVVTFRIIEFPAEAFTAEYPFDALPIGLAWLFIVMSSLVAGICEETGFRGYMQVPLEKRYGPVVAITIVSIMFLITHLHQAWALPILFHVVAISVLLGILAYASGSLIPSMIGHTVMDIFNFSYWWSDVAGRFETQPIGETGIDSHFILWLLVFTVSVVLFFRLIVRRYERASLIITSNKSFLDWGEIFNDHVLATAILDRLLHHSTTLNIKGESFRLKEKRRAGLLGQAKSKADMDEEQPITD